jgi:23S rRNA (uracil1939-C5)-methyltransferase
MSKRRRSRRIEEPFSITLTAGDMLPDGSVRADHEGQPVFVDYALPGERLTVEVYRRHGDALLGRATSVQEPARGRVTPRCEYFGRCGGCQWQHIAYERQLELKAEIVRQHLRDAGFEQPPVSPSIGMEDPWAYRNHGRFTTGRLHGEIGFTERRTYRFLPVNHCPIMHPRINEVLAKLQRRCQDVPQTAIRVGENTGALLAHPRQISDAEPSIASGQPYYYEEVMGHRFRISAGSFFQTNTRQTARLFELVRQRLALTGTENVVDAYGGVGMFAALIAPHAASVISIEESASAVEDARANTAGLHNVELIEDKVERVLPGLAASVDAFILDPPRVGCHPDALRAVGTLRPARLVYVSCDPGTLARDLRLLTAGAYEIDDVTPVDMFPHTVHIECVATLTAR